MARGTPQDSTRPTGRVLVIMPTYNEIDSLEGVAGHLLGRSRPELLVHVLPPVELDEEHGQRAPGALRARPVSRRQRPSSPSVKPASR